MFQRFKSFLIEAEITSSGVKADRYREKYLNPKITSSHNYRLNRDAGHLKAGEHVKVKGVHIIDNKTHVSIHHPDHPNKTIVIPSSHLEKPAGIGASGRSPTVAEDSQINDLHAHIKKAISDNNGAPIKVFHHGKTHHITGIAKVTNKDVNGERLPKSDARLISAHGEKHDIHLSLKASVKPGKNRRWQGLSNYKEHPQVKDFIDTLKTKRPRGLMTGDSFIRPFETKTKADKHLHKSVMFGKDHDQPQHGVNNVHSILYGKVGLESHRDGYKISAEKSIHNDKSFKHSDHPMDLSVNYQSHRNDFGQPRSKTPTNMFAGISAKGVRKAMPV